MFSTIGLQDFSIFLKTVGEKKLLAFLFVKFTMKNMYDKAAAELKNFQRDIRKFLMLDIKMPC